MSDEPLHEPQATSPEAGDSTVSAKPEPTRLEGELPKAPEHTLRAAVSIEPSFKVTTSAERLLGIEIANYRAFRGLFHLDLPNGDNLVVYGENGVGKSSLYHTLKDFFEAPGIRVPSSSSGGRGSTTPLTIEFHRHRFTADKPAIKLTFRNQTFEWSESKNDTTTSFVRLLNQSKGFLDYKALLEIHYVRDTEDRDIDLFPLLINRLLPYYSFPIRGTSTTFQQSWRGLNSDVRQRWRSAGRQTAFLEDLAAFNGAMEKAVQDLGNRASTMLAAFDDSFAVEFHFEKAEFKSLPKRIEGPRILAKPAFRKLQFADYHRFFNEARLNALAICLFFAALKDSPATGPRILALDDILIGLDMANRVKIVDLIQSHFSQWQIFIFTYSKAWFERLKEQLRASNWSAPWESVVFWEEWRDDDTSPRIVAQGSADLLEMAKRHLKQKDYAAAAVYGRKALESLCHAACAKASLHVVHVDVLKHRTLEHLLNALKPRLSELLNDSRRNQALEIFARLEQARAFVLNRNAHFDVEEEDTLSAEVKAAITVVEDLGNFLTAQGWSNDLFRTGLKLTPLEEMTAHLQAARKFLAANAMRECQKSMKAAHEFFWIHYGQKLGVLVPIGAKITAARLWKAASNQKRLSDEVVSSLAKARGYLFGSVKDSEFKSADFEATAKLIEQLVASAGSASLSATT